MDFIVQRDIILLPYRCCPSPVGMMPDFMATFTLTEKSETQFTQPFCDIMIREGWNLLTHALTVTGNCKTKCSGL
jgi:hypothetical protein